MLPFGQMRHHAAELRVELHLLGNDVRQYANARRPPRACRGGDLDDSRCRLITARFDPEDAHSRFTVAEKLSFFNISDIVLSNGPIVYRLGHHAFNVGSRVRLPVGPRSKEIITSKMRDFSGVINRVTQTFRNFNWDLLDKNRWQVLGLFATAAFAVWIGLQQNSINQQLLDINFQPSIIVSAGGRRIINLQCWEI